MAEKEVISNDVTDLPCLPKIMTKLLFSRLTFDQYLIEQHFLGKFIRLRNRNTSCQGKKVIITGTLGKRLIDEFRPTTLEVFFR